VTRLRDEVVSIEDAEEEVARGRPGLDEWRLPREEYRGDNGVLMVGRGCCGGGGRVLGDGRSVADVGAE
jgi:hypothetical protein